MSRLLDSYRKAVAERAHQLSNPVADDASSAPSESVSKANQRHKLIAAAAAPAEPETYENVVVLSGSAESLRTHEPAPLAEAAPVPTAPFERIPEERPKEAPSPAQGSGSPVRRIFKFTAAAFLVLAGLSAGFTYLDSLADTLDRFWPIERPQSTAISTPAKGDGTPATRGSRPTDDTPANDTASPQSSPLTGEDAPAVSVEQQSTPPLVHRDDEAIASATEPGTAPDAADRRVSRRNGEQQNYSSRSGGGGSRPAISADNKVAESATGTTGAPTAEPSRRRNRASDLLPHVPLLRRSSGLPTATPAVTTAVQSNNNTTPAIGRPSRPNIAQALLPFTSPQPSAPTPVSARPSASHPSTPTGNPNIAQYLLPELEPQTPIVALPGVALDPATTPSTPVVDNHQTPIADPADTIDQPQNPVTVQTPIADPVDTADQPQAPVTVQTPTQTNSDPPSADPTPTTPPVDDNQTPLTDPLDTADPPQAPVTVQTPTQTNSDPPNADPTPTTPPVDDNQTPLTDPLDTTDQPQDPVTVQTPTQTNSDPPSADPTPTTPPVDNNQTPVNDPSTAQDSNNDPAPTAREPLPAPLAKTESSITVTASLNGVWVVPNPLAIFRTTSDTETKASASEDTGLPSGHLAHAGADALILSDEFLLTGGAAESPQRIATIQLDHSTHAQAIENTSVGAWGEAQSTAGFDGIIVSPLGDASLDLSWQIDRLAVHSEPSSSLSVMHHLARVTQRPLDNDATQALETVVGFSILSQDGNSIITTYELPGSSTIRDWIAEHVVNSGGSSTAFGPTVEVPLTDAFVDPGSGLPIIDLSLDVTHFEYSVESPLGAVHRVAEQAGSVGSGASMRWDVDTRSLIFDRMPINVLSDDAQRVIGDNYRHDALAGGYVEIDPLVYAGAMGGNDLFVGNQVRLVGGDGSVLFWGALPTMVFDDTLFAEEGFNLFAPLLDIGWAENQGSSWLDQFGARQDMEDLFIPELFIGFDLIPTLDDDWLATSFEVAADAVLSFSGSPAVGETTSKASEVPVIGLGAPNDVTLPDTAAEDALLVEKSTATNRYEESSDAAPQQASEPAPAPSATSAQPDAAALSEPATDDVSPMSTAAVQSAPAMAEDSTESVATEPAPAPTMLVAAAPFAAPSDTTQHAPMSASIDPESAEFATPAPMAAAQPRLMRMRATEAPENEPSKTEVAASPQLASFTAPVAAISDADDAKPEPAPMMFVAAATPFAAPARTAQRAPASIDAESGNTPAIPALVAAPQRALMRTRVAHMPDHEQAISEHSASPQALAAPAPAKTTADAAPAVASFAAPAPRANRVARTLAPISASAPGFAPAAMTRVMRQPANAVNAQLVAQPNQVTAQVSEPGSLLILGLGITLLGIVRRRLRKNRQSTSINCGMNS